MSPTAGAARGFASDNYAGAHPEALAAIAAANEGHAGSYGNDPWTGRLQEVVREPFGAAAVAYPVFNGTPATANVVAVNAIVTPEMRAAEPEKSFATFTDAADIAAALAYLCSDAAQKMNGRRLVLHP